MPALRDRRYVSMIWLELGAHIHRGILILYALYGHEHFVPIIE